MILASFLTSLNEWNAILILIALLSIIGLAVFIERVATLQKSEIDTDLFLHKIRLKLNDRQIVEALQLARETKGFIAQIVKVGISRHHHSKEYIEQGMEVAGVIEIATLEKNAKVLSMIAHLSPLVGLLGTVLGFIQAFSEMRLSGLMDISATQMGAAMEYALITTAAGLAVAIPAFIGYNYLVSRIETFVLEAQIVSSELVDILLSIKEEW